MLASRAPKEKSVSQLCSHAAMPPPGTPRASQKVPLRQWRQRCSSRGRQTPRRRKAPRCPPAQQGRRSVPLLIAEVRLMPGWGKVWLRSPAAQGQRGHPARHAHHCHDDLGGKIGGRGAVGGADGRDSCGRRGRRPSFTRGAGCRVTTLALAKRAQSRPPAAPSRPGICISSIHLGGEQGARTRCCCIWHPLPQHLVDVLGKGGRGGAAGRVRNGLHGRRWPTFGGVRRAQGGGLVQQPHASVEAGFKCRVGAGPTSAVALATAS